MSHTLKGRQIIANDTVDRTPSIIASTPGASADSKFYEDASCPVLDQASRPDPPYGPSRVLVINSDSFTAAREMIRRDLTASRKIAVLNLASDEYPGGGWLGTLSRTQEEALCYSSTLYKTLRPEWYPWPNLGKGSVAGIFSPAVVVFKDDLDHDCVDLAVEDRVIVSVITVAGPHRPTLTSDQSAFKSEQDINDLRGKIRLVLRMAAHNAQDRLVLGAMGCGAYGCPSRFVANEMKAILLDDEFKGWFKEVVFAVYSSASNGPNNFVTFSDIYEDVVINQ
ncbi:hypothetical protein K439DRAFT_1387181 [Ramaria rubella]|nr:hypothetical protein K439DRAFT_1387181 [Ramaria rubella]